MSIGDDDDFVRITLRLPKDVHASLIASAAKKRSMNAEIIERLERSFAPTPERDPIAQGAADDLRDIGDKFFEAAALARRNGGRILVELKVEDVSDDAAAQVSEAVEEGLRQHRSAYRKPD